MDSNKKKLGAVVVMTDITEIKKTEKALKLSSERIILATDGANLGLWNWNTDTGEVICNNNAKVMFGIPTDLAIIHQDRLRKALHPDDLERTAKVIEDALENHRDYDAEFRSLWTDGSIHWISAKGRGYYDSAGKPCRMEGVCFDISEFKHKESELEKSISLLNAINDGTSNLVCIKDKKGQVIFANPAMIRFVGKSEEEIIGRSDVDIVGSLEQSAKIAENDRIVMKSGVTHLFEESGDSLSGRWNMLFSKTPFRDSHGNVIGVIGIGTDITRLKETEDKVQKLLKEKELLLKEVHHRTQNNINIISSLLELHALSTSSQFAIDALKDAKM